ncbi:MAG: F0F1 ATP synthase subunit A [Chloroflexi bacterium]|nr:F0F1 ATP synthase subunit A [Chloroflexota bacterium]
MNLQALKTPRGRLTLVFVVLVVGGLFAVGVLRKEAELPVISLAAEEILLPFSLPLYGNHIPNTLPSTLLTMAILILIGLAYNRAQKKDGPPSRFRVAAETVAEGMLDFMENAVGEKARLFFPLVATFFLFIAISNWCGILPGFGSVGVWDVPHTEEAHAAEHEGEEIATDHEEEEITAEHGEEHDAELELVPLFRSANAHLSTTLALAIVSVGAAQYFGFKALGASYLNKYLNFKASSPKPDPSTQKGLEGIISKFARGVEIVVNGIVGLLEIILEVLKVLPFSFRLFGNIFAGEVLLFVVSFLFAFVFPIIFLGLELFVGLIQGLIFAMLTLVFFSIATTGHGDHDEASH